MITQSSIPFALFVPNKTPSPNGSRDIPQWQMTPLNAINSPAVAVVSASRQRYREVQSIGSNIAGADSGNQQF
jgi:hypothetical protein